MLVNIDLPCGCNNRAENMAHLGPPKIVMGVMVLAIIGIGFMFVRSI
jgi:hypothetical protein